MTSYYSDRIASLRSSRLVLNAEVSFTSQPLAIPAGRSPESKVMVRLLPDPCATEDDDESVVHVLEVEAFRLNPESVTLDAATLSPEEMVMAIVDAVHAIDVRTDLAA